MMKVQLVQSFFSHNDGMIRKQVLLQSPDHNAHIHPAQIPVFFLKKLVHIGKTGSRYTPAEICRYGIARQMVLFDSI